tara:strand:+ start:618 stop:821 length:204 start_codon:yes stop_codon:yes gene_type:complete
MSERHPQGRPDDDWDADAKNDVFQKRNQKTQSMYFLNLVKNLFINIFLKIKYILEENCGFSGNAIFF